MQIKNPVLRFAVGLPVLVLAAIALVFLSFGVGSLINAYEFPDPYVIEGIGFWGTVALGFVGLWFLCGLAYLLYGGFHASRWVGNRLLGPKK